MARALRILSMSAAITATALLVVTGPSLAAAPAQVYVVHGIDGRDLGLDASLPVDVLIDGESCVLPGFEFGSIVGPLPLEEGT